jgi:uncharacterized protein (DUF952 family)
VSGADALFHIADAAAWAAAGDEYVPAAYGTDGFIHLSRGDQLAGVGARYYAGAPGLVLLEIRYETVAERVRWEPSPATGEDFPHLYGPLPRAAVLSVRPFAC